MKLSSIILEGFGDSEFKKAPTGNNDGFKAAPINGNDGFKPFPTYQPTTTQNWYMPIFNWTTTAEPKYKHQLSPNGEFFWVYIDADDIMNFRNDGFFSYQRISGKTDVGKWMAKPNGFIIKCDNGDVFDSDVNKWVKGTKTSQLVDVVIKPEEIVNGSKLVKIGMRGDIVTQIQNLLIKKGFKNISKSGQSDGIYGSRTKKAVIDFQIKNDLTHDGIVGKKTWDKLNSAPSTQYVDTSDMDTPESLAARDAAVKADAEAAAQKQNNQPNKIQEEIRKIVSRKLKSLIN